MISSSGKILKSPETFQSIATTHTPSAPIMALAMAVHTAAVDMATSHPTADSLMAINAKEDTEVGE